MYPYKKSTMVPAFTMIELIFIILIISILATTAIQKLAATRDDAMLSTDISNMSQCVTEVASRYVAAEYNIVAGDSLACDAVTCYTITYASAGSNFIVVTNPTATNYCSDVDVVGGHLAKTYILTGTSVSY